MTNFDFNTAGEQKSFDVIPANITCILQVTIRPGGAGDGGWLKRAADGASEGLDCEFTVVDGQYAKRKVFQLFTLQGTTQGHVEAGEISRKTLRAILESARGIRPDDKSDAAQLARKTSGWQDFDQLRFFVRLGVKPATEKYPARNTILEVITPERSTWKELEQLDRGSFGAAKPGEKPAAQSGEKPAAPAGAIARPQWAAD